MKERVSAQKFCWLEPPVLSFVWWESGSGTSLKLQKCAYEQVSPRPLASRHAHTLLMGCWACTQSLHRLKMGIVSAQWHLSHLLRLLGQSRWLLARKVAQFLPRVVAQQTKSSNCHTFVFHSSQTQ